MAVKKVSKRKVDNVPEPVDKPTYFLVTLKDWVYTANGTTHKVLWGRVTSRGIGEYRIGDGGRAVNVSKDLILSFAECPTPPPLDNNQNWGHDKGTTWYLYTPNPIWIAENEYADRQDYELDRFSDVKTTSAIQRDPRTFWQRLTGVPAGWSNRNH